MRVLHCIPGMGGGGAERQLTYLSQELPKLGWDVHVATLRGGPNLERLVRAGATVHWLPDAGNHNPSLAVELWRVFRATRPDVVQLWFVQMQVLGGITANLLRIPWVLCERSSDDAYPKNVKNRARRTIAWFAGAVVSNSLAGDQYWATDGVPAARRHVIPNSLPLDEIDRAAPAAPQNLGIPTDVPLIVSVGRFVPEKNWPTLVAALRIVAQGNPLVSVFCGDGPLRDDVQRLAAQAGIATRTFFPGYLTAVWSLMKIARMTVAVSLFEGRPNSVIEAMACGSPLVVSDIPAHREILNERSAVFVDARDPHDVARGITTVLLDPETADRRATVARAHCAEWSTAAIASSFDRVYRSVTRKSRN